MTPQKSEMGADFDIKFGVNSVIGILVDRQNGFVNFFKDGMDLGQAFKLSREDTEEELFPIIHFNHSCKI